MVYTGIVKTRLNNLISIKIEFDSIKIFQVKKNTRIKNIGGSVMLF